MPERFGEDLVGSEAAISSVKKLTEDVFHLCHSLLAAVTISPLVVLVSLDLLNNPICPEEAILVGQLFFKQHSGP